MPLIRKLYNQELPAEFVSRLVTAADTAANSLRKVSQGVIARVTSTGNCVVVSIRQSEKTLIILNYDRASNALCTTLDTKDFEKVLVAMTRQNREMADHLRAFALIIPDSSRNELAPEKIIITEQETAMKARKNSSAPSKKRNRRKQREEQSDPAAQSSLTPCDRPPLRIAASAPPLSDPIDSLIIKLLGDNPGLLFFNMHNDSSSFLQIANSMAALAKDNVKVIFMELAPERLQTLLRQFNQDGDIDRLRWHLSFLPITTPELIEGLCLIAQAAYTHGIQVIACDTPMLGKKKYTEDTLAQMRLTSSTNHTIASFMSEHTVQLPRHAKFIGFYGAMHTAIAVELSLPSVLIVSEQWHGTLQQITQEMERAYTQPTHTCVIPNLIAQEVLDNTEKPAPAPQTTPPTTLFNSSLSTFMMMMFIGMITILLKKFYFSSDDNAENTSTNTLQP